MSKLMDKVREAESLNREMMALARTNDADAQLEILRLRSRFSRLVVDMLNERSSDPVLSGNSALAERFDELFREVRSALSAHQGAWHPRAIESDPSGYRQSAATVNEKQVAFYSWCSQSLA